LLTLFGLHPGKLYLWISTIFLDSIFSRKAINPARRYYGVISTLSIFNSTKYIFNLDQLCSTTNFINNCLDIVTSTAIVNVATTITINQTVPTMNYSYILLVAGLVFFYIHRKVSFCAI